MRRKAAWTALYALGILTVIGSFLGLLAGGGRLLGVHGVSLIAMGALWILYAYTCYSNIRREETALLLRCAVQANVPLVPAIRTHLYHRPRQATLLITLLLPISVAFPPFFFITYWVWWRRHDRRLRQLCELIENGESLGEAMDAVGGVTDWETRVAIWLGNATHRPLKTLLRHEQHSNFIERMEVLFRLLYPAALLLIAHILFSFIAVMILSRFHRIFVDLNCPTPTPVAWLKTYANYFIMYAYCPGLLVLLLILSASFLLASPGARWWFPIVSRHFRQEMRGKFLHTLGMALEAGMTLPDALQTLLVSQLFTNPVERRIKIALQSLQSGIPVEEALYKSELLPRHQKAFVQSAIATNTLPQTLMMIGNHHISSASIRLRRLAMIVSPLCLLMVAGLVAFVAVAVIAPLVQIMESLL